MVWSVVQDMLAHIHVYNSFRYIFSLFPSFYSAASLYRWPRNAILHDLSLLCEENLERTEELSSATTDQRKYETPRFFQTACVTNK